MEKGFRSHLSLHDDFIFNRLWNIFQPRYQVRCTGGMQRKKDCF